MFSMFSFVVDKPPDNHFQKQWYFKRKQQYTRFLRFYGNSLVGGIDQAKIITVAETGANKKTGKTKQGKMVSFDKETFNNISFPKQLDFLLKMLLTFYFFYRARGQQKLLKRTNEKEKVCHLYHAVQVRLTCLIINFEKMFKNVQISLVLQIFNFARMYAITYTN